MRILITAGPTREPIDPVRFISNRSSGRMGYAVAECARDRGHDVVLVSGPVCLPPPAGVTLVSVCTAEDMLLAVKARLEDCDALIMVAAVADWKPAMSAAQKIKKGLARMTLELEATPDILTAVRGRKGNRLFVGFAAETENLIAEAKRKRRAKGLDLMVANDVSRTDAGFESDNNCVTLLDDSGVEALPLLPKRCVAERIVMWMERQRARRGPEKCVTKSERND